MDRQSILIVDDSPDNIEVLAAVLGEAYETLFATDGEAAIELAVGEQPDLILLDIGMPLMDGYEVCRRLRADSRTQSIPVVFITGRTSEADEERGLVAGAIDYVTKPISGPILRARVRNHLELKRYRDVLVRLSTRDGLTGIANRRRFDEVLEQEWSRGRRHQTAVALLMIDVDFFKPFNDSFGHIAGDDCLRQIAGALEEALRRPADMLARYGGEEFVCLLPDTDHLGLAVIAENLRQTVECLNIRHPASAVAGHVTISLGGASLLPRAVDSTAELVQRADAALYQAKFSGRNRVVLAEL